MKRLLQSKTASYLLVVTTVILLATGEKLWNRPALSLSTYANQALTRCQEQSNRQTCYEQVVPELVSSLKLNDQFAVVSLIMDQDRSYNYCHVLGHRLGTASVRGSPDTWAEAVSSCASGSCSNGCIHGALQEKFDVDGLTAEQVGTLIPQLRLVCENRSGWQPTENDRTGCYHALGHTTIYLTKAAVPESIQLCQEIAINKTNGRSYLQNCLEGLFMQIFQPLEPEDSDLVKNLTPTKDQLFGFCDQYSDQSREACYREGWVLYGEELQNPDKLTWFCTRITTDRATSNCYSKMFYTLMNTFNFDLDKMENLCLGLTGNWVDRCFADAASRYITAEKNFADRAVAACQEAGRLGHGEACYSQLASYSAVVYGVGSTDQNSFCQKLPVTWQEQCLNSK